MQRTLEPMVMDTPEEASDYDAMDHAAVNGRFCDDLLRAVAAPRTVFDAGTGTARIVIALCERAPGARVHAVDLASSMLAIARRNVAAAGLADRIRLESLDAKATGLPSGSFDTVMSNSLAHHLPEPAALFAELWRLTRPGGWLFVRDLARPESAAGVRELVAKYAAIPDGLSATLRETHERQRALLDASLHAALTIGEVAAMVAPLGVAPAAVALSSDRHWTLAWEKI